MEKRLPKNWVETEVGVISEIIRGITYNKLQAKSLKENDDYLILRGGNIQDGKITTETKDVVYVESSLVKKQQQILKGDVVIVGSTGSKRLIGKAGIAKKDYKEISFGAFLMLIRPSELIEKSLFDYYFISDNYRNVIRDLAGGVNINNIRREYITGLKFPLPPLKEQERIVAKLDTLFTHLDSLKTRLASIPTLLKNFRQAILTQAVTGKLTQEWRKGKELEEWKEMNLEELVLFAGNGLSKRSGDGVDLTVLRLANFKNGVRVKGNERKIQLTEKEQIKYTLNNDDLLIIRVNGSVDLAGLFILYKYEGKKEAFCDHFIRLTVDSDKIIPLFLTYISNDGKGRLYLKNSLSTSAGQNTINQKSVKGLPILLPSIKEQTEIVNSVENLFAKADKIEAQYLQLKQKIDSLPQAILAKAFKGELVPQLPTDGDAKELLKQIKALKV